MPITKQMMGLPSRTMPQTEFDAASEKLMVEFPQWGAEANALEANVNALEASATDKAAAAAASALQAQTAAANSVAAVDLVTTSSDTRTLANGDFTFNVGINKGFKPGMPIVSSYTTSPGQKFIGYVISYNPATGVLVMGVEAFRGTGTYSAWTITISGPYITPFVAGGAASAYGITADRVLTTSSGRLQDISVAAGVGYVMPNAMTLNIGPNQFALSNSPDVARNSDALLKDGSGRLCGFLPPNQATPAHLLDNTTPGGRWIFPEASPIGLAASTTLNASTIVGGTNGTFMKVVVIDSDRVLLLLHGVSLHAVIYKLSTNTFSSAVLLRSNFATAGARDNVAGILYDADKVLVTSVGEGGTAMQAIALTLTGTGITPATPVSVTLGGACARIVSLLNVGASYVFSYMVGTTSVRFRAITVAGTVPAAGTETALSTTAPPALMYSGFSGFGVMTATSSVLTITGYTVSGIAVALVSAITASVSTTTGITLKQTYVGRYVVTHILSGIAQAIGVAFTTGSAPVYSAAVAIISSGSMTTTSAIQSMVDSSGAYHEVFTAVTGTDSAGRFMVEFASVADAGTGDPVTRPSLISRYFSAAPTAAPIGLDGSQGLRATWQVSTDKEVSFFSFFMFLGTNFTVAGQQKLGPGSLNLARQVSVIYPKDSIALGTLNAPVSASSSISTAAAIGDGSKPAMVMKSNLYAAPANFNLQIPTDSANGDFGSDKSSIWMAYNQANDTALYIAQVRIAT